MLKRIEREKEGERGRQIQRCLERRKEENEIDTNKNQGQDSMWLYRPREQRKAALTPDGF